MKEKINELQELLLGKEISHKTKFGLKTYNVKTVVERASRIVIETVEGKTFTEAINTIEFLLKEIKVIGDSDIENGISNVGKIKEYPAIKVMYVAPEEAKKVSDGLMSIFNDLTSKSNVSDADLKKYKAVSDIAGKIIDIEKVKLGYLALNYR